MKAWIGTFTGGGSEGIYRVDAHGAKLSAQVGAKCVSPSYLTVSPDGRFLYVAIESDNYKGSNGGAAACFAIDGDELILVNERLIRNGSPCHIVCDKSMKHLICSNFGGGFASVFSLNPDGSIGALSCLLRKETHGRTSHVHQAVFSPDESMLAVTDLGLDSVDFYEFNSVSGVGKLRDTLIFPPGSGPRHMVFSENGCFHIACECSNEVLACGISASGKAVVMNRHNTLMGAGGSSYCGAVRRTTDGCLLVTNRGEDTLALFAVLADGGIALRQHISCGGSFPRDAAFSPDESLLLCANQKTGSLTLFSYANGVLSPLDVHLRIPDACCVAWSPA